MHSRGASRLSTQTRWAGRSRAWCLRVNGLGVAILGGSQVHKKCGGDFFRDRRVSRNAIGRHEHGNCSFHGQRLN
jgi:hypothetical protein